MVTIETKPGVTIGFYKPPVLPYMEEFNKDSRKCIYVNNTILHVFFINKLSEITEDQAKELVDLGKMEIKYKTPTESDFDGEKRYVDLNELYEFDKFYGNKVGEQYKHKLKVIAESVGIEEKDFDQYLVIKL